jgi:murein DD-endopeptidase MepM/ murein hydrolase activator NlpD
VRTQSLPGGGVLGYDPQTGKVIYEIAGKGSSSSSSKDSRLRSVGGSVYEQDPATGKWSVAIPGPTKSGGSSGESASTISNTVKRATTAGEAALDKVLGKIARATDSGAEEGTPEFARDKAAYDAQLPRSFRSAITRVTQAIGPHLKAIGYTPAQVKVAAFKIVSAEIDPPKGYKAPTAKNVSYTVDLVTPKTGVVTTRAWKGTHVTDNLDWNGGAKTAVDIMAKPGTPVGAPEDGTIVRHGSAQGGSSLYFQGRSGKMYWLGHIDSMAPVGTTVRANQRIALISADHAAPHLHIDVRNGAV